MAAPVLVDEDMTNGREAIKPLAKDPFLKATGFLWMYYPGADEWRFMVATSALETNGPMAVYRRILTVLRKNNLLEKLPLDRITAIGPSDKIFQRIKAFREKRFPFHLVADTRLANCDLGEGFGITNVLVYKFP